MNFSYENQGSSTYLVYTAGADEELDSMTLGMLTNNDIKGLADTVMVQMDGVRYIRYNVTARVTMQQLFSGMVNKRQLLGVFGGIADAWQLVEEYMIDPASILMDPNYIFVNAVNGEVSLVCLPIVTDNPPTDILFFLKNTVANTKFDTSEGGDYVVNLMNYVNSMTEFSPVGFKEFLESMSGRAASAPKPHFEPKPAPQFEVPPVNPQPAPAPQPAAFGGRQGMPQGGSFGGASQGSSFGGAQGSTSFGGATQGSAFGTPQSGSFGGPQGNSFGGSQGSSFGAPQGGQIPPSPASFGGGSTGNLGNASFAIPGAAPAQEVPEAPQVDANGKPISFMYLMQHYNKENAAQYKAQKNLKKQAEKEAKAAKAARKQAEKEAKKAAKAAKKGKGTPEPQMSVPPQDDGFGAPMFDVPPQGMQPSGAAGMPGAAAMVPQTPPPAVVEDQAPVMPGMSPAGAHVMPQDGAFDGAAQGTGMAPGGSLTDGAFVSEVPPQDGQMRTPGMPQAEDQGILQPQGAFESSNIANVGVILPAPAVDYDDDDEDEDELTVILSEDMNLDAAKAEPYIVRKKTGEKIPVSQGIFKMGRQKSTTDYCISDNKAIGRVHASILFRNGQYFIVDNDSMNHTFVEGSQLESNAECELKDGTKFALANEPFEFHV
ncbi:MAG: FHA domain-containing protein [Lachnospiraceae bacterium]|nr:FHA domain-containing protein [Lachnospiraceae bacterium]